MSRSRKGHHVRRSSKAVGAKQGTRAESLLVAAHEAQRRNRTEEATRHYHQAAVKIGNQPQIILSKAQQLEQTGATESAIALVSAWVRCYDGSPMVRLFLANLLFQEAQTEEALALTVGVLDDVPKTEAACLAALCCEHLNRLDDAKKYVDTALQINPDDPQTNITKAHLEGKAGQCEEAIHRLERVLRSPRLIPQLKRKAWHELGTVLERTGDSDRAFAAFTKCGRITKETSEYRSIDIRRPLMMINQYRKIWSPEWLTSMNDNMVMNEDYQKNGSQLVFLIGFPRSGTTMTEQILCAHGMIHSADERPYLHETRQEARRLTNAGNDVGIMLTRLTKEQVIRLRKSYYQRISAGASGEGGTGGGSDSSRVLIDKLPLNLLDLPFIVRVFPDCRIITALRDPRDVCLSCLMQDFRLNSEMAHFLSLSEAAQFYEKVMSFYLMLRSEITVPMIEIRYEDTVADLPGQSRRLTEFLDISWEENMLRFHEQAQRRNISTPSYEAVRKPINSRAIARWKRYGTYFEEVQPHLQRFIEVFGYED